MNIRLIAQQFTRGLHLLRRLPAVFQAGGGFLPYLVGIAQ